MMVVCHTYFLEGSTMSKGNPIIKTRISKELLAEIEEAIARNQDARDGAWTISKFIIQSIKERLGKLERGKKSKKKHGNLDAVEVEGKPQTVEQMLDAAINSYHTNEG
jgi:DNA-binding transcriptional regulator PaaX